MKKKVSPSGQQKNWDGLALQWMNEGKFADAESTVQRWLLKNPTDGRAYKILGVIFGKQRGKHNEALMACEKAAALLPLDNEAHKNLAVSLVKNKRHREAVELMIRRANATPGNFECHRDLARVLQNTGQREQSLTPYAKAIELAPEKAVLMDEMANVQKSLGQFKEAIALLTKAVAHEPSNAQVQNNLAVLLSDQGQVEKAIGAFKKAIEHSPEKAVYWNNLGNNLYRLNRIAEALEAYQKAVSLDPGFGYAVGQMVHASRQLCQWQSLESNVALMRKMIESGRTGGLPPFVALSQPGITLGDIRNCALHFSHHRFGAQLRKTPMIRTATYEPRKDKRIRIGYLSADFHDHATSYLMVGVLEHHDRKQFEVYAYSYGPDHRSPMRSRVRKSFDVFHDVSKLTDEQAAQQILKDGIDILIDLKGFTRDMRLGIQALRPAPVVVSWLGYPGTLGEPRMADYVIGDPTVTPLEHAPFYSEKLALMPHTYQPNDRSRSVAAIPTREQAGLPPEAFVFCTFNQAYKITPDMLDLWARILEQVPGSVLWLLTPKDATARGNLLAEAERRGLAAERIIFAPNKPQAEHLARLSLADLALDTLPYTSHTTCSDALWVGLPLVTLLGETFPARVAAGLLRTMDLPELVAETPGDYVRKVVDIALHPERLKALREKIKRNRETLPLFDTARFTRDLEKLYLRMWANHQTKRHEHIVPWQFEHAMALSQGRKPAPMKIAVVTPYHKETEAELRQCHESVLNQTVACTHFMVADGFPRDVIDGWDVRHIRLPVAHGDGGNCARAVGSMAAVAEEFDAIAFLDADNWYAPDHLETLLALQEETGAEVCFARRNMHRVDGSYMFEDESRVGVNLVDTSCYLVTRPAFPTLSVWGLMPKDLWGICDRIFLKAIKARGYRTAVAAKPTLAYRTQWAVHYEKMGEPPPEGAVSRDQAFKRADQAYRSMTPVQVAHLFKQ